MRIAFVQNCPVEGPGLYEEALARPGVEIQRVRADRGEPFPRPRDFDAVISGGTPTSASTLIGRGEPLVSWLQAVAEAEVPCLAICCSAQILGHLAGGALQRLPAMEIGLANLRVADAGRRAPILEGFPQRFPAFQWHADYVEVPPGGRLLVEGTVCRPQMFRLGAAVALLFHLEVDADRSATWCRAYESELPGPRGDLLEAVRGAEASMTRLRSKLLENWLATSVEQAGG